MEITHNGIERALTSLNVLAFDEGVATFGLRLPALALAATGVSAIAPAPAVAATTVCAIYCDTRDPAHPNIFDWRTSTSALEALLAAP